MIDPLENPVKLKWFKAIGLGVHAGLVWFFITACTCGSVLVRYDVHFVWILLPPVGSAILLGFFVAFGNLRLQRDRQRRMRGLCLHCGYDLRASPSRCPECGRPIRR